MVKLKKILILFSALLISLSFASNGIIANAVENAGQTSTGDSSSYYDIYYNGEKQKVIINEYVTLTLLGWADESKTTVSGELDIHSDSIHQKVEIILEVTGELKEISIPGQDGFYYKLSAGDFLKVNKVTTVAKNENETSIEKVETIDENGVITGESQLNYYSTDEQNQKVAITKDEYDSINTIKSPDNSSTVENSPTAKQQSSALTTFSATAVTPTLKYATHVQDIGWQEPVSSGIAGTVGKAKQVEAVKISLENATGGIKYKSHVQDIGWQDYVSDGKISGTTGKNKQIESVQIVLTGNIANQYDIYYRVHVQDYGWLDWAKNGEAAGTQGLAKQVEAIEMKLVKKGEAAPGSTTRPFINNLAVTYSTHVQDYGWTNSVSNGVTSGKIGKQIEAIKISLKNSPYSGGISYKSHVQDIGWQDFVSNGNISGTTGKNKQVEAVQIKLMDEMANRFDIYYRVYSESYGWLGWAKNGEAAGTQGMNKQVEAIEVVLVNKGGAAPGSTEKPFLTKPSITYSTHVQDYGWMNEVKDGAMSGTQGKAKQVEAIKISLKNTAYAGGVSYKTFVQDIGWQNLVADGNISGTTGQNKQVEAIQISLTGEMAQKYDVYYRVHAETFGWLGWAKNGAPAGTEGLGKQMGAIEIVLVEKGKAAPGSTEKPFLAQPSVSYSTYVEGNGWMKPVSNGATSGTQGQNKQVEAIKISLQNSPFSGNIIYSAHLQDYGWLNNVLNGAESGYAGKGKQMEAIKIQLSGELANYYDVYYRVHVQDYGWLGWAKNGMKAGTSGLSKQVEAVEIKLVTKGTGKPVSESESFKSKNISYTSYNLTLNDAINLQMKVNPLTDKQYAYVDKTYIKDNKVININSNSYLNVRSGPGVSYAAIGELKNGDSVKIIAEVNGWYVIEFKHRTWVTATPADVRYYLNPNNFAEGTTEYFQFLKLSNTANLDANEINTKILSGKGILSGRAAAFITAGVKYNVNEVYLISHALLETGQGTSNLSNGSIEVGQLYYDSKTGAGKWVSFQPSKTYLAEYKDFDGNGTLEWKYTEVTNFDRSQATNIKKIYNMYGIGAVDSAPDTRGSIKAYQEGWFDPNTAIIEGANFIAASYIHAGQDTLYEMRWNPQAMAANNYPSHQYATDIGWAVKQTHRIKQIYDQLVNFTLVFDVPKYK